MSDEFRDEEFDIPERFLDQEPGTRPCPNCKAELNEDADYCPHCEYWFIAGSRRKRTWLTPTGIVVLILILLLILWGLL